MAFGLSSPALSDTRHPPYIFQDSLQSKDGPELQNLDPSLIPPATAQHHSIRPSSTPTPPGGHRLPGRVGGRGTQLPSHVHLCTWLLHISTNRVCTEHEVTAVFLGLYQTWREGSPWGRGNAEEEEEGERPLQQAEAPMSAAALSGPSLSPSPETGFIPTSSCRSFHSHTHSCGISLPFPVTGPLASGRHESALTHAGTARTRCTDGKRKEPPA